MNDDFFQVESRVSLQKEKPTGWGIYLDGQKLEWKEVKAHLQLFAMHGSRDPLTTDISAMYSKYLILSNDNGIKSANISSGLNKNKVGNKKNYNHQHICVFLSDLLQIDDIEIAEILGWMTDTGTDYSRMIKKRKKEYYEDVKVKFHNLPYEKSTTDNDLITLDLFNQQLNNLKEDFTITLVHTLHIIKNDKYIIDNKNSNKSKKLINKLDNTTKNAITEFIDKVLHLIK